MVQILVHFLLLTALPSEGASDGDSPRHRAGSSSPSKKRKASSSSSSAVETVPTFDTVEAQLELLMDKLAIWQLVDTLDDNSAQAERARQASAKGKHRADDDRDWMQVFCEDTVEKLCVSILLPSPLPS